MSETPELPVVTRQQLQLTSKIVEQIKAELVASGLPPKIYKMTFDGDTFVFRPLYRPDWNRIQAFLRDNQKAFSEELVNRKVCEAAVIFPDTMFHPTQWDLQRAGYADTLAKFVMAKSGFFDPNVDQSDILSVEPLDEPQPGLKPDEATLAALREKYASWPRGLKLAQVGDDWYVTRPLTRGEWKAIQKATERGEEEDQDLAIVQRALIYPPSPKLEDSLAGAIRALAAVILESSGFALDPVVAAVEEL
jgi:hypothetical protein